MSAFQEAAPLWIKHGQGPYRFLPASALESYRADEIASLEKNPDSALFTVKEKGAVAGALCFSPTPWESKVFGAKMGAIKFLVLDPSASDPAALSKELVQKALTHVKEIGFSFLACKTFTNETRLIHALQSRGFLLVDTLLDYAFDRTAKSAEVTDKSSVKIRRAEKSDLDQTMRMARESFLDHFGRFHSDPKVSKEDSSRFYPEWIRASFEGYADFILVAEDEGRIVGCSIWRFPTALERKHQLKIGHFSLGVVHPSYGGQGVFRRLATEGTKLFADQPVQFVQGPTHINNYPVQRAYKRMDWQIVDARHSFHLWLDR